MADDQKPQDGAPEPAESNLEGSQTLADGTPVADKTVPYDRFKAANDKVSSLEARLAEYEAQAQAAREAEMTELQKLQSQNEALSTQLATAQAEALRLQVASAKGVPPELAHRLLGSTQEEMEADADHLLAHLKPAEAPGVPPGRSGRPAPGFDISTASPEEIREAVKNKSLAQIFGQS